MSKDPLNLEGALKRKLFDEELSVIDNEQQYKLLREELELVHQKMYNEAYRNHNRYSDYNRDIVHYQTASENPKCPAYNVSDVSNELKKRESEILRESKKIEIELEGHLKKIKLCTTKLEEENKESSTSTDKEDVIKDASLGEILPQEEENPDMQILGANADNV